MPEDAHDVGLLALGVDRVAHGFAINGQAVVLFAMDGLPALEGSVELRGIDADEQVAYDVFTRYQATTVRDTAAEPRLGLGAQTLGPRLLGKTASV